MSSISSVDWGRASIPVRSAMLGTLIKTEFPALLMLIAISIAMLAISPTWARAQTAEDVLILGVRSDAPPFSEKDENGQFKGYSVALCRMIAQRAIDTGLYCSVRFEEVSAQNRFIKLADGSIHLLCGASTVTLERMRIADFSLFTFLSGASVMFRSAPLADDAEQPGELRIGVLEDTTTDAEVRRIVGEFQTLSDEPLRISKQTKVLSTRNHNEGLTWLQQGKIDAYLADREILLSLQQKARATIEQGPPNKPRPVEVSERYFTFEPYAIGISRDQSELRFVANQVLSELFNWESRRSNQHIFTVLSQSFPGKQFSKSLESMFKLQRLPVGTRLADPPNRVNCHRAPVRKNSQ